MRQLVFALAMLGVASTAVAQDGVAPGTRTVESSAGVVGQRQNRAVVEEAARLEPMARLDSRVANRIRSRLHTRIDRDPAAAADALSVFGDADERGRRNPAVMPPR